MTTYAGISLISHWFGAQDPLETSRLQAPFIFFATKDVGDLLGHRDHELLPAPLGGHRQRGLEPHLLASPEALQDRQGAPCAADAAVLPRAAAHVGLRLGLRAERHLAPGALNATEVDGNQELRSSFGSFWTSNSNSNRFLPSKRDFKGVFGLNVDSVDLYKQRPRCIAMLFFASGPEMVEIGVVNLKLRV